MPLTVAYAMQDLALLLGQNANKYNTTVSLEVKASKSFEKDVSFGHFRWHFDQK
jgi:hypothetical protein